MSAGVELLTVDEIVAELVTSFSSVEDWPAEHTCTKVGPVSCTHQALRTTSLVDRLTMLIRPGTSFRERGGEGKVPKGAKAGSPAPWDASAAELLDEIFHGAIDLASTTRKVLGFTELKVAYWVAPPGWHPPLRLHRVDAPVSVAPLDDAGRAALRDIPTTRLLLGDRHPGHWLARGELVSKQHPSRGYRQGWVEERLRDWHRRAQVITGHVAPPVVLRQMANPVEERHMPGPICAGCQHVSCVRISYSHKGKWVTVRCPHCGAAGLPQDPVSGLIYCPRPRCRDEDGNRREWAPSALKHLGLDPTTPETTTSRLKYSTETSTAEAS